MFPRLRLVVSLAVLSVSWSALAHLPHEYVLALAGDPDFATSGKAYLIMAVDGSTDGLGWWPYASLDHGMHWDPMARPATNADFAGLVVLDGRPIIATGDGALWWRDGAEWERLTAPTPYITSITADWSRVAIGGATGVYWTDDPRGAWQTATTEAANIVNFASSDSANLAVRTRDGRILFGPPEALVELPDPPVDALDITQLDGVVYIGGPEGVAVHRTGFWAPCAALPVSRPELDYATRVTRVLATRGVLHAGTGQYLYDSTDGCGSWMEVDAFAEDAAYGTGGGMANNAAQSFVGLIASEEYTVTGGFRGAVVRKGALEWHSTRLNDGAFVRGIAMTEPRDGAGRMWWTSYGGALLEVVDGGQTFRRIAQGSLIESEFGRDVAAHPSGTFAFSGDLNGYGSADQGATLSSADMVTDHLVGVAEAAGRLWALGSRDADTVLAVSDDGQSYTAVDIGEGGPMEVADVVLEGEPGVLIRRVAPAGLLFSNDGGDTWIELGTSEFDIRGVVAWPPGEGTRLVRATDAQVEWSEDRGATWTPATTPPVLMPEQLRQTDAGAILGFDDAGRGWRSRDGGDTWSATLPLAAPQDIVTWGEHVIVATVRGVFWSDDLGDTWFQAPFQEHLSPRHEALVCLDVNGAAVSCYDPLGVGSQLRFTTRGDHFRVVTDDALAFDVTVNTNPVGGYAAGDTIGLPGGGWSDVELDVTGGLAGLFHVEIDLDGDPIGRSELYDTGEPDTAQDSAWGDDKGDKPLPNEGCSCSDNGGAGLGGFLALAGWRRRRSRLN